MNKVLQIAIISTNQNKYSETFIHNHVRLLPGKIHFLYDGYLPSKYSTDGGISGNSLQNYGRVNWFNFWKKLSGDKKHDLGQAIELYLAKNKIDVLLCEYGPSGVELMPVAKRMRIPLVVHFHGYDAYRQDILQSYGKQYKILFTEAKAVIVVSEHMKQQLLKLGCPEASIHLLPYGIDTDIFQVSSQVPKINTFVSCGRFVQKKAPELTIRAFEKVFKKLSDVNLVMIGDGELLETCKSLVDEKGLTEVIEFKGALNQIQVAEIFNQSAVFIHPSATTAQNDSEGTPLAILEAGACGLPVISTRHGGIPAIIEDGETGYLLTENDVEGLADKMIHLATHPELTQSLGHRASVFVQKNYNLANYNTKLYEIISRVAG